MPDGESWAIATNQYKGKNKEAGFFGHLFKPVVDGASSVVTKPIDDYTRSIVQEELAKAQHQEKKHPAKHKTASISCVLDLVDGFSDELAKISHSNSDKVRGSIGYALGRAAEFAHRNPHTAKTIGGAALGTTAGAIGSEKGHHLEGAGKGAVVGGLAGQATSRAPGFINERAAKSFSKGRPFGGGYAAGTAGPIKKFAGLSPPPIGSLNPPVLGGIGSGSLNKMTPAVRKLHDTVDSSVRMLRQKGIMKRANLAPSAGMPTRISEITSSMPRATGKTPLPKTTPINSGSSPSPAQGLQPVLSPPAVRG